MTHLGILLLAPELSAQCELAKVVPADPDALALFGSSAAIHGNLILLGAPVHDGEGASAGAVYILERNGPSWPFVQKLVAPDAEPGGGFGWSTAISNDRIAIGALGTNGVYLYLRSGAVWNFQQKLTAPDGQPGDDFGRSVGISADVLLVGANGDDDAGNAAGSAYVFRKASGSWLFEQKLFATDGAQLDQFGFSVSLDSDLALIGAYTRTDVGFASGAAYLFRNGGGAWSQEQKLVATDASEGVGFGYAVSQHGDIVLVGAPFSDEVCPADHYCNSGSAYVFRNIGLQWIEEQKLTAADAALGDEFGISVSIQGTLAVIGAYYNGGSPDQGAAYIFQYDGTSWVQTAKLTASDGGVTDLFGSAVTTDGRFAVIGAHRDNAPLADSGSAYIFGVAGDCNGNTAIDICEIDSGASSDLNDNLIPDECEPVYGDLLPPGGNFVVDVDDLLHVLDGFSDPVQFPAADVFPCNGNGVIDVDDILAELDAFSGIAACVWDNGMWVPN